MEHNGQRICRYLQPGQAIQLVSPQHATFAEVIACEADRVVARTEGDALPSERVIVRAPVRSALFQASASLSLVPDTEHVLILDTFANMQCTERRSDVRLKEPLSAHVYTSHGTEDFRRIAAVNLGPRGLLLGWPEQPSVSLGERIRVEVLLDEHRVIAEGEVIRLNGCHAAVRFTDISPTDQDRIAAYVFRQEAAQ